MTTTKEAEPLFNISKNTVLTLEAIDYTFDGKAVCKHAGLVVFVKGMLKGEVAEVKIVKVLERQAYGVLVRLLLKSPDRVEPKCPLAGRCGGCQLQHFSPKAQADFKFTHVQQLFAHHLGFHDVQPILSMEEPWAYRNKAQVPFTYVQGHLRYGFYREHSHDILPMARCDIQDETMNLLLASIRDFYQSRPTSAQALRTVVIKKGFESGELMVILVSRTKTLDDEAQFIREMQTDYPSLKAILINHNPRLDNVILSKHFRALSAESTITDTLDGLQFKISAASFYQVNPKQTVRLYQTALDHAHLSGNEQVLDVYSGIGTIACFAAKRAQRVVGLEVVKAAVFDARSNAALNKLSNVDFKLGEASDLARLAQGMDVVIVDPPRKGLDEATRHALLNAAPPKLIYISCNPSTLVRDLGELTLNYAIETVVPVDMFPQTYHVECVVLMSRV